MQLLAAFLVALAITMLLVPPLGRLAMNLKLLDQPGDRKVHSIPVPRIGGAAMALGVCAALLLTAHELPALTAYLVGAILLLVVGVLDDRFDLDWRLKLLGQALAALVAIWLGDFRIESLSLTSRLPLPEWISLPLSFLFIVGVTNAINLSDGLDGLAGGTALLCSVALTALGFVADNLAVALAGAALAGALLGFLRFNTHPARVFMGDGGSQFLGFSVAILAIDTTQPDAVYSAALPLLLLAWPIVDTLSVIGARLLAGQSPFAADRRHLHHRLLGAGLGHGGAVYAVYATQVALFVIGYLMRFEHDFVILGTFLVFAAVVLGAVRWLELHPVHREGPGAAEPQLSPAPSSLRLLTLAGMGGVAAAYAVSVVAGQGAISTDVGALAAALLTGQCALLFAASRAPIIAMRRVIAYVTAVTVVYLDTRGLGLIAPLSATSTLCFALLAFLVVVAFRLSGARRIELNTLDLLVIFLAVIVPSLPGLFGDSMLVGSGLAKVVTLFYALEFLIEADRSHRLLGSVVALTLATLAWRSLAA